MIVEIVRPFGFKNKQYVDSQHILRDRARTGQNGCNIEGDGASYFKQECENAQLPCVITRRIIP